MVKLLGIVAGTALLAAMGLPAVAADLYEPPVVEYEEAPPPSYAGWYLRGHIGMSNQHFDGLDYFRYNDPAIIMTWPERGGFDSAPLFGVGVGYQVNQWLRGDLTAEYRAGSTFHALDTVLDAADPDNVISVNDYGGKKSEWLFLANAYADFKNSTAFTPYIGVGLGTSRNTISHFRDNNGLAGGGGYAGKDSEWNFAWALHAGVGIQATDRLTVDLGYSYVDLGDGRTGTAHNYDPALSRPNDGFKFEDLTSHDFKLGIRYAFN